tara:strand:+ start:934 stop:1107 length:174 start_codon:yes stop_codon:yes gene_type:complete
MEYEDFIAAYTPYLAILDAIDRLKDLDPDALDYLNREVEWTKADKNGESHDQTDPTP